MELQPKIKLIARNATAARQSGYVTGNAATTRPESGVGNCFPGLEMDLRNLERRFFPFLAVDFNGGDVEVVEVDLAGAQAAGISGAALNAYRTLSNDMDDPNANWIVVRLHGFFGPLGEQALNLGDDLDGTSPGEQPNRRPPDVWTAVRLLDEGSQVDITLRSGTAELTLSGTRARYLDDNGTFAAIFEPGELTQSLCSPWTHDFRDCGCYYWASNHPDIVLPPLPAGQDPQGDWNRWVGWQRADRGTPENPSPGATAAGSAGRELEHIEINGRWQELDVVLETRERRSAYTPRSLAANPLPDRPTLVQHIQYAAGVEIGVIHEYLAAMYSLNLNAAGPNSLRDDVESARAELLRILYSEMIHLRKVNDILRALHNDPTTFRPALRVAATLRGNPVRARRLEPAVLEEFIELERPSASVDGLYARILATLEADKKELEAEIVRGIMADGLDHFQTFEFIGEWLSDHPNPASYLLSPLTPPTGNEPAHQQLQARYREVLNTLRQAYLQGLPGGGSSIAQARALMLGATGLEGLCENVTRAGLLVTFDAITNDPEFAAIAAPPP